MTKKSLIPSPFGEKASVISIVKQSSIMNTTVSIEVPQAPLSMVQVMLLVRVPNGTSSSPKLQTVVSLSVTSVISTGPSMISHVPIAGHGASFP